MHTQTKMDLSMALARHGVAVTPELSAEVEGLMESYANHVVETFANTLRSVAASAGDKPIGELIEQALLVHKLTHE